MLKYSFTIVFCFIAYVAMGQEVLTLDSCRHKALEHSQNVKTAEADYSISKASYKLSKLGRLPQFDFSATYNYMNKPQIMEIPGFELPTITGLPSGVYYPGGVNNLTYHNNYSGGVDLSLPLYMGGKLRHYVKMSEYGVGMAEHNLTNTKENLILQVDQQYWGLVSLKENLNVLKKSVKLLEGVVNQTQNWADVGLLTGNEVLKVKVELNNAKLAAINLANNISLAKMALNQTMGNSILDDIIVADSVVIASNMPVMVADIERKAEERHELQILANQVNITEEDRKAVRSDYLPQLVSFANYGFQNPNHKAQDETEMALVAGVSVSIPVFHWGERHVKMQMKNMESQKAQLNYDKAKDGLILEIQQSVYQVNESLVKITFTEESLEQADENLHMELNRLNEGVVTTTDVLDAQVQWQRAYADFIDSKVNYKVNLLNYKKVMGSLNY
nr:TolC family protein [uncultured Carboxylicivirga sp.]